MTGIPYNYGKYIDDTVRLKDQGVVDAKNQVQSPASAGSRGLNKTTQFTNDKTQMRMGNSPMAESIIEIRNILNRIDGVNVPVQEVPVQEAGSDRKLLAMVDNLRNEIMEHPGMPDDTKTEVFTSLEEIEQAIHMMNDGQDPATQESQPDADAERADAAQGMWASSKEIQSKFKTWQDFMNAEDFDEYLDDKYKSV